MSAHQVVLELLQIPYETVSLHFTYSTKIYTVTVHK